MPVRKNVRKEAVTYAENGGEYASRLVDISFMFYNQDAHIQDNQDVKENFLRPDAAAALFNLGVDYHKEYASDEKLGYNGGSLSTGINFASHSGGGHAAGLNLDIGYMSSAGQLLHGNTASARSHPGRNEFIASSLLGSGVFGRFLTGSPASFGGQSSSAILDTGHRNHIHFQPKYRVY